MCSSNEMAFVVAILSAAKSIFLINFRNQHDFFPPVCFFSGDVIKDVTDCKLAHDKDMITSVEAVSLVTSICVIIGLIAVSILFFKFNHILRLFCGISFK